MLFIFCLALLLDTAQKLLAHLPISLAN